MAKIVVPSTERSAMKKRNIVKLNAKFGLVPYDIHYDMEFIVSNVKFQKISPHPNKISSTKIGKIPKETKNGDNMVRKQDASFILGNK